MEGELIRLRVEASVKARALEVCEKLGFDLAEVLRAFLTRLAEEGRLPFDLDLPSQDAPRAPFSAYAERLWRAFKPVDAEVALALLAETMAGCAQAIDAERSAAQPDAGRIGALEAQLATARETANSLDPDDADAVAAVLARLAPQGGEGQRRDE